MHLATKLMVMCMILGSTACTAELSPADDANPPVPESARWAVRLPGKAGIYNDGLIGLPIIEKTVLFHSTMFTNAIEEDNRLFALDLETGTIKWTFPDEYNSKETCFFSGKPYVYNSKVIIKMPAFSPFSNHDRILLLDGKSGLNTGLIHLPVLRSRFTTRDVTGFGEQAYFIQEGRSETFIYRMNVLTGDTSVLARIGSAYPNGKMEMTLRELSVYEFEGQHYLLLGMSDYNAGSGKASILLLNASTGEILYSTPVITDENFPVNDAVLAGSRIVYTSGRKAVAIDIRSDSICWQVNSGAVADSVMPGLIVQNNTVFLWGHQSCKAVDLETGRMLFRHPIECANVNGMSPWILIVDYEGQLTVIHEKTGKLVKSLRLPETADERYGISYGCKPGFDGHTGVFLFGKYHAYYFPELLNQK